MEKIKVINKDDNSHEYTIIYYNRCGNKIYKLYTGTNGWSNPNQIILKIINNGDGLKIKWNVIHKSNNKLLDWSQSASLFCLLSYIHNIDPFMEYSFVKEEELFSI